MDPDRLIENVAEIIESLAQALTRTQGRLDDCMGDLSGRIERLKEELAEMRSASATTLLSFGNFQEKIEALNEKLNAGTALTQAQIIDIQARLQIAHEWILLEKERRKIQEEHDQKQETKAWREQVTQTLVRFGALLAAGAAGGGMSAAMKLLGVA